MVGRSHYRQFGVAEESHRHFLGIHQCSPLSVERLQMMNDHDPTETAYGKTQTDRRTRSEWSDRAHLLEAFGCLRHIGCQQITRERLVEMWVLRHLMQDSI